LLRRCGGSKSEPSGSAWNSTFFFIKPRLKLLVRYEAEFGAGIRTQGQTVVFELEWVAKSLIKQMPPTEPALGQHKHARLLGVDGTCTGPAINS
jgi:hypothetical protein